MGVISLVSAVLSVMGSSFMVVHYMLHSKGLVLSKLIFFLAISDLFASATMVISGSWILDQNSYPFTACIALRSIIEFFIVASFLWTSCISLYLYTSIVRNKDMFITEKKAGSPYQSLETKIIMLVSHILCWGVPLAFCIFLIVTGKYQKTSTGWCHPEEPTQFLVWELPMIMAFFWNLILYCLIVFSLRRQRNDTRLGVKGKLARAIQKRLALFLVVYVVCWLPDLVSHVEGYFNPHCWLFFLGVFQNALAPAQGFLNCFVYGLSNPTIRSAYKWWQLVLQIVISPLLVVPVGCLFILELFFGKRCPNFFRRTYEEFDEEVTQPTNVVIAVNALISTRSAESDDDSN